MFRISLSFEAIWVINRGRFACLVGAVSLVTISLSACEAVLNFYNINTGALIVTTITVLYRHTWIKYTWLLIWHATILVVGCMTCALPYILFLLIYLLYIHSTKFLISSWNLTRFGMLSKPSHYHPQYLQYTSFKKQTIIPFWSLKIW